MIFGVTESATTVACGWTLGWTVDLWVYLCPLTVVQQHTSSVYPAVQWDPFPSLPLRCAQSNWMWLASCLEGFERKPPPVIQAAEGLGGAVTPVLRVILWQRRGRATRRWAPAALGKLSGPTPPPGACALLSSTGVEMALFCPVPPGCETESTQSSVATFSLVFWKEVSSL